MFTRNIRRELCGSVKKVKTYFRRKFRLGIDSSVDDYNNTLLHTIVKEGDEKEILELLARGAHVNATNDDKETPLHLAVKYGRPNLIDPLINYGAQVEAKTNNGSTPMHLIRESPKKVECLEKLLKNGANINARDEPGNNLLHLVIKSGLQNINLIKKLIENGSDVNNLDGMEENCLHSIAICSSMSNYESRVITKLLITEGINLNAKNILAETPLHKSVWGENTHLTLLLLQNGASLDIPNYKGFSPFMLAIKNDIISSVPLRVMIKHILIKNHRGCPIDEKKKKIIESDSYLISLYLNYERELMSLKSKNITKFSGLTFYDVLCNDENLLLNFISCEDSFLVLGNVAIESSKFHWEIVNTWDRLLLMKKIGIVIPADMEENHFLPRLFLGCV